MAQRPLALLPLGTLEWHGEHLPFGVDALISEALMRRLAERHGGVVLPPIHVGPDREQTAPDGEHLVGMDFDETTRPPRRLEGSAYWVREELFVALVEAVLSQLRRAGFAAVFADGHGPSRWCWAARCAEWSERFDLVLVGIDAETERTYTSQVDHAGRNETSLVLAARPELVRLDALPADRQEWPQGVAGEDPRDARANLGERWLDDAVETVQRLLRQAGV